MFVIQRKCVIYGGQLVYIFPADSKHDIWTKRAYFHFTRTSER